MSRNERPISSRGLDSKTARNLPPIVVRLRTKTVKAKDADLRPTASEVPSPSSKFRRRNRIQ